MLTILLIISFLLETISCCLVSMWLRKDLPHTRSLLVKIVMIDYVHVTIEIVFYIITSLVESAIFGGFRQFLNLYFYIESKKYIASNQGYDKVETEKVSTEKVETKKVETV